MFSAPSGRSDILNINLSAKIWMKETHFNTRIGHVIHSNPFSGPYYRSPWIKRLDLGLRGVLLNIFAIFGIFFNILIIIVVRKPALKKMSINHIILGKILRCAAS